MLANAARSVLRATATVAAPAPARVSPPASSIRALHTHGSLPPRTLPKRTVTTSAPTPLERNMPRKVDQLPWPPKLRASSVVVVSPSRAFC